MDKIEIPRWMAERTLGDLESLFTKHDQDLIDPAVRDHLKGLYAELYLQTLKP